MFHYLPTFFHLHVHFAHAKTIERSGAFCGKGVLLDDVIDHMEMDGDYFLKKAMMIQVGEQHALYKILQENGVI